MVSGPPTKLLSKMLKPALEATPTLITMSKQVTDKLLEIRIPKGKRAFLITADVVSMYTNIPLDKLAGVCERAIYKHSRTPSDSLFARIELSRRLCDIANSLLIFEFQEGDHSDFYHQVKGLAMGVACSPDLANLYMAEYEQHMPSVEGILLYQRYIDDIFTIILADSEEDAERRFRHSMPAPPGLEFTVEVSEHRMVFLDLEIFRNKKDSHFQFRAFRKPLNHFERIPFSSAHPYWMKRGAFVSELSRLATLSSC